MLNFSNYGEYHSDKKHCDIHNITGGDRSVTTLELEDSKINSGYTLRFASAVEDQKYHKADLEITLTTDQLSRKIERINYIRYVRLNKI
jgi:hypothetical protein